MLRLFSTIFAFYALQADPALSQTIVMAEIKSAQENASGAYFDGRPEDAENFLRYAVAMSSAPQTQIAYLKELGALLSETGQPDKALVYWTAAAAIEPDDPFIAVQQGWNQLSAEKFEAARISFKKLQKVPQCPEYLLADAKFGLAMAETKLIGKKRSIPLFQAIYTKNPYLLSLSAFLIGESFIKLKQNINATTFLKQSLIHDPKNFKTALELAEIYEKTGNTTAAWQGFYTLSNLDPHDLELAEKTQKMSLRLKSSPRDLFYWTKIGWPLQKNPRTGASGPEISVGLYADAKGKPAPVTDFKFICTSDFIIRNESMNSIGGGKADSQWNVSLNQETKIYEIRDNFGKLEYSTRQKFYLEPKTKGSSILIKTAQFASEKGIDIGDREIRGSLLLKPADAGLVLINNILLDNYIPSILAKAALNTQEPEALKALAVLLRTKTIKMLALKPHEGFDFCDSAHCLPYSGLHTESPKVIDAADAVKSETLVQTGGYTDMPYHEACGGITEDGVDDGGEKMPEKGATALHVLRRSARFPPKGLFCAPNDDTGWARVTWTILIDAGDIARRINRDKWIGKIKAVVPLKRAKTGRILSMRIHGTAADTEISGEDKISYALFAGALRSTLFSIRALFDGKYPDRFIIRGIGTGNGEGYCIAGAEGMARSGIKYKDILKHYFPKHEIKKQQR